jgi:hypothetical protein
VGFSADGTTTWLAQRMLAFFDQHRSARATPAPQICEAALHG